MNGNHLQESIGSVRRRLWLLLLRAFSVVVVIIVLLTLTATYLFVDRQTRINPFYTAPVAYLLKAYYQGHDSWQGVEELFTPGQNTAIPAIIEEWEGSLLVDSQGRIVVDHGSTTAGQVGQIYMITAGHTQLPIMVNGELAGTLVFNTPPFRMINGVGWNLMPPLVLISILLGFLTVLIGLLLMRRVVDPLAEVIAAARSVASGDLKARVPLRQRRDDLYALSASFNQMAEALDRQDQQRRMMLEDIAHELRTPLSILRGRLEGIVDGIYPAGAASIAPALEETYLMERLVDDLHLLTLAEAHQIPLEVRLFDLQELASKVVSTFSAEADELGIQLFIQQPDGRDETSASAAATALADPQRVEQVIGNLIGNSLRYTPDGGQVKVHVKPNGKVVSLQVADNGPGVADVDLDHIFERFWRGEKSRSRASGGAGLGLSISRKLVEAMGGKISASNLPEGGLEVSFTLPAG